jgi:hypothetical protein
MKKSCNYADGSFYIAAAGEMCAFSNNGAPLESETPVFSTETVCPPCNGGWLMLLIGFLVGSGMRRGL